MVAFYNLLVVSFSSIRSDETLKGVKNTVPFTSGTSSLNTDPNLVLHRNADPNVSVVPLVFVCNSSSITSFALLKEPFTVTSPLSFQCNRF